MYISGFVLFILFLWWSFSGDSEAVKLQRAQLAATIETNKTNNKLLEATIDPEGYKQAESLGRQLTKMKSDSDKQDKQMAAYYATVKEKEYIMLAPVREAAAIKETARAKQVSIWTWCLFLIALAVVIPISIYFGPK